MRRTTTALMAVLVTLALGTETAQGQAWTRSQGSYFVKLGYGLQVSSSRFGPDSASEPMASFVRQVLSVYGEVGVVARWLTLSVAAEPYRHNRLGDEALGGVGNIRLGAFSGLVDTGAFRLTAGLLVGLPISGSDSPSCLVGTTCEGPPPTADGELDLEYRLSSGYAVVPPRHPLTYYVTGDLGYWQRTEGFADAMTYGLELGMGFQTFFWDRFVVITRVTGVEPADVAVDGPVGSLGIGNGVANTSWGLEVFAHLDDVYGVSVGFDHPLRGRNELDAVTFQIGLTYEDSFSR